MLEDPTTPEPRDRESSAAQPASEVLRRLCELVRRDEIGALRALPTGFDPLDRFLSGGVRPGELVLVGGAQGVGKTTMTLQMARNMVARSQAACGYVCYEHDAIYLMQRLIALESLVGNGRVADEGFPVARL